MTYTLLVPIRKQDQITCPSLQSDGAGIPTQVKSTSGRILLTSRPTVLFQRYLVSDWTEVWLPSMVVLKPDIFLSLYAVSVRPVSLFPQAMLNIGLPIWHSTCLGHCSCLLFLAVPTYTLGLHLFTSYSRLPPEIHTPCYRLSVYTVRFINSSLNRLPAGMRKGVRW